MRWIWYWIKRCCAGVRGWRTMLFNLVAGIAPVLQLTEVAAVMPAGWLPWYALAMALMNMWLRSVTTTPVGRTS